ncbi:hypothetical protein ACJX0J_021542 [Zea mays]
MTTITGFGKFYLKAFGNKIIDSECDIHTIHTLGVQEIQLKGQVFMCLVNHLSRDIPHSTRMELQISAHCKVAITFKFKLGSFFQTTPDLSAHITTQLKLHKAFDKLEHELWILIVSVSIVSVNFNLLII